MAWIKVKNIILIVFVLIFSANVVFAQESLWKTFNDNKTQVVPSYNGGLSPFPQKQKEVEEVTFQPTESISEIELIEQNEDLTEEERRMMMTTTLLSDIKDFLETDEVFYPNLNNVVIEAVAKSEGKYKALIFGQWLEKGDKIRVPINEARQALELLESLKEIDMDLAETVEDAVISRTKNKGQEIVLIRDISKDQVVFEDHAKEVYIINFIKAPF